LAATQIQYYLTAITAQLVRAMESQTTKIDTQKYISYRIDDLGPTG